MLQSFGFILTLIDKVMDGYGLEGDTQFQSLIVNGQPLLRRYSPAPSSFNSCACSVSYDCPDPSWSGGQFICQYGRNCTAGSVIWRVPGIAKSCTTIGMLFNSDLRCLFNQTCIDTLLSMYNVDMPSRLPLPESTLHITALNNSIPSRFSPTTKIRYLFYELALEEWNIHPSFENYYNVCSPIKCTYIIPRQMNVIYILSTIVGFYGGLSIIFRLLVPLIVRFIYWIIFNRRNDPQYTRTTASGTSPGKIHISL
ncbi:unnamed protein product [Rotaria sp. Silwood2]|nr:unnamed protein product [Rotaria sp. Silwood2]